MYLTTPIYYVNDAPHLGHAYTTVIADALARWARLRPGAPPTRLVTGTDEHGLKVQRAAEAAGRQPREHADATARRFADAWHTLDVAPDAFVRTTSDEHRRAVTAFLQAVYDSGHVYLGRYTGRYCVPCEAYYTGSDLRDGDRCPVHDRPVEKLSEENYFFRLSAFGDRLLDHYARHPDFVRPAARRNEALALIKQGLRDFSISRTSISWGIPLPWDESHVAYVWADALVAYLTAAGYPEPGFSTWWGTSHHLIGKDILRFHAVYWPALLFAAGLEPPRRISVHGFLLLGGEKISKTGGLTAISPTDQVARFGVDGVRYHLLRDNPFGPDGEFSYEGVVARYNADLANTLGNLVARVTALVAPRCGGIGPVPRPDSPLAETAAAARAEADTAWAQPQPAAALAAVWRLVAATNSYLVANEPWHGGPDHVLGDALEALRIVAVLAWPAIPGTAEEIWRRIGLQWTVDPVDPAWGAGPAGRRVTKGAPLFPRIR